MNNAVDTTFNNVSSNVFDGLFTTTDKDTKYHTNQDPLAYFVKWSKDDYKCIGHVGSASVLFKKRTTLEVSNPELFDLSEQDRTTANNIRDYYNAKILSAGIRCELTDFQKAMYAALSNLRSVTEQNIGLLYRIVQFYAHDTFVDSIIVDSKSANNDVFSNSSVDDVCVYLGHTNDINKRTKTRQYWFRDSKQQLLEIFVDMRMNARCLPVMDQYLNLGSQYHISDVLCNSKRLCGRPDFYVLQPSKDYSINKVKE